MALMETVKRDLGICHDRLDGEIDDAILAAGADLRIGGAQAGPQSFDGGVLYRRAVKLYCRAWFNYQGQGERWGAAYEDLKKAIALCRLYREEDEHAQQ